MCTCLNVVFLQKVLATRAYSACHDELRFAKNKYFFCAWISDITVDVLYYPAAVKKNIQYYYVDTVERMRKYSEYPFYRIEVRSQAEP